LTETTNDAYKLPAVPPQQQNIIISATVQQSNLRLHQPYSLVEMMAPTTAN